MRGSVWPSLSGPREFVAALVLVFSSLPPVSPFAAVSDLSDLADLADTSDLPDLLERADVLLSALSFLADAGLPFAAFVLAPLALFALVLVAAALASGAACGQRG